MKWITPEEPESAVDSWCFGCKRVTAHREYLVSESPPVPGSGELRHPSHRTTCQVCLGDCPVSHVQTKEAIQRVEEYRQRFGEVKVHRGT